LNKLARVLVAVRPGKYCGPVVITREDQTQAWQRGGATRYVQPSNGEDDEKDEHPNEE